MKVAEIRLKIVINDWRLYNNLLDFINLLKMGSSMKTRTTHEDPINNKFGPYINQNTLII